MSVSRRKALDKIGIPGRDLYDLLTSNKTFPDGCSYRIEISGVEMPEDQSPRNRLYGNRRLRPPLYDRIRATLDIDIALATHNEEKHRAFIEAAEKAGYTIFHGFYRNPVCLLLDTVTGYEVEAWSRPDGVKWDVETLRRRRKVKIAVTSQRVISPEDFIGSKLARPDRGVTDEQDVKSVLERTGATLEWAYLRGRAEHAGVWALLEIIRTV
ncbi:hypothetical protein JXL21_04105 [Candidatus Bathyarchaeota archaeon]|nr:hypothetical protein [Candidatus Bathyarchaeota archaeon]